MKLTLKLTLLALLMIGQAKLISAQTTVKNNQIKWSPVRMIDLVNPGIELGYERLYSGGDLSTQISYGYFAICLKQHLTKIIGDPAYH